MANSKDSGADRRRRATEQQKAQRAEGRVCGWCESPDDVILTAWYGRPPKEGEEAKKPLRIPICAECLARLDNSWPDGTALCGHCGEPTNNIVDWLETRTESPGWGEGFR